MDNKEGKMAKFIGPIIEAESYEAAMAWCSRNAAYLFVEQEIMTYESNHTLVCSN